MTDTKRAEPDWLDKNLALAIHDRQLAEHGGAQGVRDMAMLESALARPINAWHYGEDHIGAIAAGYAFGIAKNHPFTDGNKRTAWVLARLFLEINGYKIRFEREDAIAQMLALAAGELAEDELATWFRTHKAQ